MWITLIALAFLACGGQAAQRFVQEPADQQVIRGQTHIFSCSVRDLIGQVQWMKDGFGLGYDKDLPGYPRYSVIGSQAIGEYSLMISNAQLEDDALYECQIGQTATTSGIVSRKARLDVLIPPDVPEVEGGPQIVVTHGKEFNLTCHAKNSKPAPNITWSSSDSMMLSTHESLSKQTTKLVDGSSILTITPDKNKDQGKAYKCHATNEALTNPKWTRVYLEVQFPPEVAMTEYPRIAKEYGQASFKCEASAKPESVTWKWFADGKELADESSSTLTLQSLSRELHTKDVVCEATNSVGVSSRRFKLNIEYGPRFISESLHAAADIGGSSSMFCQVDGNPSPAVFWRRKGDPSVLSTQEWYNITAVSGRHFGVYTCTASAPGFSDITRDVHLMENRPPKVLGDKEQKARFGETGVLFCRVESVPKPTEILWYRDGRKMEFKTLERYTIRMEDVSGHPEQQKSVMEIVSVQDEDYGKYNCSVDNGYGVDAMEISFDKQEVLPLPYILAAVLVGVLLIIILSILVFVYHKRKSAAADSDSDVSEDSIAKKKEEWVKSERKVRYAESVRSNPVDACQSDVDGHSDSYCQTTDSFEKYSPNDFDFNDGYGNNGYDYAKDIYGTFPRHPNRNNYTRFPPEDPYASAPYSNYGTYRPSSNRAPYAASDYGPSGLLASDYGIIPPPPASDYGVYEPQYGRVPPPPPSISSRLSTNV